MTGRGVRNRGARNRSARNAERSRRIPESGLHLVHRVAQRRSGEVIPLHVGEPAVPISQITREAFVRAVTDGRTEYCDAPGLLELRELLVEKLRIRNGIDSDVERVFVTPGSCEGISAVLQSVAFDHGVVLLPEVHWPTHVQQVFNAGMSPQFYSPAASADALVESLDRLRGPRTCAVVITSPANPSGAVTSWDAMRAVHEWARTHSIWVISDEAYEDFVYHGSAASIGSLDNGSPERDRVVFSTYSFSKGASMSGARLGYVVAPDDERATLLRRVQEAVLIAPSTPTQWAGIAALQDDAHRSYHHRYLAENRAEVIAGIDNPAFFGGAPDGGWYALLELAPQVLGGAQQPWETVLAKTGVVVAPGAVFLPAGHELGGRLVRIALCADRALLLEGVRRLRPLLRGAAEIGEDVTGEETMWTTTKR